MTTRTTTGGNMEPSFNDPKYNNQQMYSALEWLVWYLERKNIRPEDELSQTRFDVAMYAIDKIINEQ
jgi:hypothetical protein